MDNRLKVQEQIKSMKKDMKECEYKHFKGNTYIVTDIAVHSETEEPMVIYRSAANPDMVWCRPLDMFLSEVDREKYPDVKQKMRFEKIVENEQEEGREKKREERKICANCIYEYQEHKDLNYDCHEHYRCRFSNSRIGGDIYSTTCNGFKSKKKKYGIVLKQKYDIDGLTKKDILELTDRLDDQDAYTIEIEAKQHECSAMGLITAEAAEVLDYDYERSGLRDFVAAILDNVDLESAGHQYEFKGINVWIDYDRN